MISLLISFLTSFIVALLIIRFNHIHKHLTADSDFSAPQKFHKKSTPRIGGIAIAVGLFFAIILKIDNISNELIGITLLLCSIPTFAIGITEDVTKRISVRKRLFFTAISSALVIQLLHIQVIKLDIPIIDFLLTAPFIGALFTIFAMTGLANAYNIIDGFHGLSSMVGVITLLAIAYIGYIVADPIIIYLSLIMAGAILGFFIFNYPRGLIFLGDGGAYLVGFWIAALSILLTHRHQNISPWFALLINGYPVLETLFTIYRRKIHRGKSPSQADGIHFHTLIYKRILMGNHKDKNLFSANSRTAPYLWVLSLFSITPALLFWNSTSTLIGAYILFAILYIWIYASIVKFKTPKWLYLK